ncbi:MAG TPA: fibronectin type III domain-containing protein [Elusimicrobiota bacterium]|nr:fibronectin type III domain-containing protein [Elusimicrobiota bacterium]
MTRAGRDIVDLNRTDAWKRAGRFAALSLFVSAMVSSVMALEMVGSLYRVTRGDITQGGRPATSGGYQLNGSIGDAVITDMTGTDLAAGSGLMKIYAYPGTIVNLNPTVEPDLSVTLTWTAPGRDGGQGTASSYVIKYSLTEISSQANFEAATTFGQTMTPQAPGNSESCTVTGLSSDCQYYFAVEARDADKNQSYLSNSTYTFTGIHPPGIAAFTSVTVSQLVANWTANGNVAGMKYQAQYASDSGFTNILGTQPAAPGTDVFSATFAGLTKNTTYYFRARSFTSDLSTSSVYTNLGATMTAVNPVVSGTLGGIHVSSVAFAWSDGGMNGAINYRVEMSTASDYSGVVYSSTVYNIQTATITHAGITPNTTYYARVTALNDIGRGSTPHSYGAFATDPVPPDGVTIQTVLSNTIQLSWNETIGTNNPVGTRYGISASTSAGFDTAVTTYSTTYNGDYTFTNLLANTTYYLKVWARGHFNVDSVSVSTLTLTQPLAPDSASIGAIYASSMTVNWNANTNGPTTRYLVRASSVTYDTSVAASSTTLNTSATLTGLILNTTYYITVRTLSNGNGADQGPITTYGATMANPPAGTAVPFPAVYATSATVAWDSNENPGGTYYSVEATSEPGGNFNTYVTHSSTVSATSATLTGLKPDFTYHFRVAALNRGWAKTDFYTIGSTITRAAQPTMIGFTTHITSMTVVWSPNGNPASTEYYIEQVDDPAHNSGGFSTATSWTDTDLSTNTAYSYQAKSRDSQGIETNFTIFTATRTRAASPSLIEVNNVIGSNTALEIVFSSATNPTAAPNRTRFAIQIQSVAPDSLGQAGRYLGSLVSGNIYQVNSAVPVWREISDWNDGVVIATGLATGQTYTFVAYAQNGDQGLLPLGEAGLPSGPSSGGERMTGSGMPSLHLIVGGVSYDGIYSQYNDVWINTCIISFTATGSYHYHYKVNPTAPVTTSEPGWNGNILPGYDIGNLTDGSRGPNSTDPLSGFNVGSEGARVLGIKGDDYPTGLHVSQAGFVDSFRVLVDTTLPIVPSVSCQYGPTDTTPINSGESTPDDTPYFTWTEPTNGTPGAISPIVGYTYSLSTDTADNPGTSTTDPTYTTNRYADITNPQGYGTYQFKVRALDRAGNWSDPPTSFNYLHSPDSTLPRVESVSFGTFVTIPVCNINIAVKINVPITIKFSEPMHEPSILADGNISIVAIRDHKGNDMSQTIPVNISYNSSNNMATIASVNPLPHGYLFELRTTTGVVDLGGNPLVSQLHTKFYTLMDPKLVNIIISANGRNKIHFPANTWGDTYVSVAINEDPQHHPMGAANVATYIDIANKNAQTKMGAFAQVINLKELLIYDESGAKMQGIFNKDASLTMNYTDDNNDGLVDGTSPPVKVESLSISWLDETNGLWIRVPSSSIDKNNKTITCKIRHFSVYGIIGGPSMDLSEAYAYPVPFSPVKGHTNITFKNLSSWATIRILTVNGELVQELREEDGDFIHQWDVKNKDGEPLASDVYFYIISNEDQKKTGKLVIIK